MYRVVGLHFTNDCKLNCPFCYREKGKQTMDKELLMGLPRYLKDITDQVALGGGEPTLYPKIVEEFAEECSDYDLICNMTTNGQEIKQWDSETLKDVCQDLTMVSLSLDEYKRKKWNNGEEFLLTKERLKEYTKIGCNLLVDEKMMRNSNLVKLTDSIFMNGFDMVFALYPKNTRSVDILPKRHYYHFLSRKHRWFYVDDLTYKILEEKKYRNWEKPCHYGKDIVSIDERGRVSGCSFSKDFKLRLKEPKDVLKIPDLDFTERHNCPYLWR